MKKVSNIIMEASEGGKLYENGIFKNEWEKRSSEDQCNIINIK